MIFNKNKKQAGENLLATVLDSQDSDIIVVRQKECDMQFMNVNAKARLHKGMIPEQNCRRGYSHLFPDMCDHCPNRSASLEEEPSFTFDVKDENGRIFQVNGNTLEWVDGTPATIMFLRDVDDERTAHKKLYNLAYHDSLTGMPNRRKFREDFDAITQDICDEKICGVIAIFDLDNFKAINDTYGHNTGDVMLRRLTEHLESDTAFKEHLYRLGGDEFVLFYKNLPTSFRTEEDMLEHYRKILSGAFLSYTMPNIELACTLSMGVAFFPKHGDSYSELLRKADIALYKAKTQGRNQLVLFEDRFDTAKKFKDIFINIQPILTAHGTTYAYEMIDRGNEGKDDEDSLNLDDFNRTLEAVDFGEMDTDTKYFITFTNHLLDKSVLNNLPKDKFVIQIALGEGCSAAEILKYRTLKKFGYSMAIVGLHKGNYNEDLVALADFVKFDPLRIDGPSQQKIVKANPGKKFIATEVNTTSDFETAKNRGFKLYQGYFFNQPVIVKKTKEIDPLKVNYFRLLQLTSTEEYVDFQEISSVISSDVALSYKLLRLLNSAAVGLRNQISSIDMAVAYLGEDSLKKWIALLALRGIGSDKPLELIRMSLIRARFGELLAPRFQPPRNEKHVFLLGLFSLLHVALDKDKEELFAEIPVADDIKLSLITNNGPHSDLIIFYSHYEYSNWDEVTDFTKENNLSDQFINECYLEAVKWYNELSN